MVMNDLRAHFRPEFLNRLDETILFKPLNKDNIYHIIDLLVKDVNRRLADKEISLSLTEACKELCSGRWLRSDLRSTSAEEIFAEAC